MNFLLYTKSLSRKENLTENLCDLPFFFRGPAHAEAPSSSSQGDRPSYAPFALPHCKPRSMLFEIIEPLTY